MQRVWKRPWRGDLPSRLGATEGSNSRLLVANLPVSESELTLLRSKRKGCEADGTVCNTQGHQRFAFVHLNRHQRAVAQARCGVEDLVAGDLAVLPVDVPIVEEPVVGVAGGLVFVRVLLPVRVVFPDAVGFFELLLLKRG